MARVTLDISGGLVPTLQRRHDVVDFGDLAEPDAKALTDLIEGALAEPPAAEPRGARDARSYEIRVPTQSGEKVILAYDGAMPTRVRALVDMITSLAQR